MAEDTSPIDAKRFALMVDKGPSRRKATTLAETRVEDVDEEYSLRDVVMGAIISTASTAVYAVVWCYFVKGQPQKYTGRFAAIETHIIDAGRPCLAHVCWGKKSNRWCFYNVNDLTVVALPRHGAQFRRLGNNDRFAVAHIVGGKVIKVKRYRQLPQAFPRDFVYVASGEADLKEVQSV